MNLLRRKTLLAQITSLLVCLTAAGLLEVYTSAHPLLRFNLGFLARGLIAGGGAFVLKLSLLVIALRYFPTSSLVSAQGFSNVVTKQSTFERIGLASSTGFGEEFLLRGFVFTLMLEGGPWLALGTQFLLGVILSCGRKKDWSWMLIFGMEALLFSGFFLLHHSLSLNVLARLVSELLLIFLFSSESFGSILMQKQLTWKSIYGCLRSGNKHSGRTLLRV